MYNTPVKLVACSPPSCGLDMASSFTSHLWFLRRISSRNHAVFRYEPGLVPLARQADASVKLELVSLQSKPCTYC